MLHLSRLDKKCVALIETQKMPDKDLSHGDGQERQHLSDAKKEQSLGLCHILDVRT